MAKKRVCAESVQSVTDMSSLCHDKEALLHESGHAGEGQLPYPHCLMPANFYIFFKAKMNIKEEDFRMMKISQTIQIITFNIKNNVTTALNAVPLHASNDYATYRKMQQVGYSQGRLL